MLRFLDAPDHVIALRFAGRMDAEDVRLYRERLDALLQEGALRENTRIGLYCDLTGLSDVSTGALIDGAGADLKLLWHLRHFGRIAVVSDKDWPAALIRVASHLPGEVEIEAFGSQRAGEALDWVIAQPKRPAPPPEAIRFLESSRDDLLAFEIDGAVSKAEMPKLIERVDAFLEGHEKVRLLACIKRLDGFDPAILLQDGLFPMKLAALRKLERYAVVGAPAWMERSLDAMAALVPGMALRGFPAAREAEAWAWVDAEPAERGAERAGRSELPERADPAA